MTWAALLLALPTNVLIPILVGVLLPIVFYVWTWYSSRQLSGQLALRFGMRLAVILAAGFSVAIAVSTLQVLRTGLVDRAARFERSAIALGYALSEIPEVLRDTVRVQPILQLAMVTEQNVEWTALLSLGGARSLVTVAGGLPTGDRGAVERALRELPDDQPFVFLRRRGRLEVVMLSAVRSPDGTPVAAALMGVQSESITTSARQTAWLLLGWATVLLIGAIIMTRRLVLLSVSVRVNALIARLRGGEAVRNAPSTSHASDELQQLRAEVDSIVSRNVQLQRESDAQYEVLVERMPDAVLVCRDDTIQFANSAAVHLFGVPHASALIGTGFRDRFASDGGGRISGAHERAQLRRHNGTVRHVELSEAMLPPDDQPRTEIVVRDVTYAVLAEHALARSESTYRALFDTAPIGIAVVDAQLTVRAANPELLHLFSLPNGEQIMGRSLSEVIVLPAAGLRDLRASLSRADAPQIDVRFSTTSQVSRRATVTTQRLSDDDGVEQYVLLWLDMTTQRALEAQIQHTQKLEAVGQLSSGIAHDFNNLLTIIRANAELLQATHGALAELSEIEQASQRGAALTRKLMIFSRKQEVTSRPYRVAALLDELVSVLRRLLPASIALRAPAAVPDASVCVDRVAFEQVMINLVTNARDAMPEGGVLEIRAHLDGAPSPASGDHPGATDPPHVRFIVIDSGSGMPDAVRARAFEPFFTTKAMEKGTGLGLAIVYGLVTQMGGTVLLDDADGGGTCATVMIPCCEPATTAEAASVPLRAKGGGGTLLLVEDNDAVRKSTAKLIGALGYSVATAVHGLDAMAQLERGPLPDIIVSDVMMPEMSGPDLIRAIRARDWHIPVVLVSGYSTDDLRAIAAADPLVDVLGKPYSTLELSRLLQKYLETESV